MRIRFFGVMLVMFSLGAAQPAAGEEVSFPSGGRIVKASVCRPKGSGPFPGVIYCHGGRGGAIGGAPSETCKALAEARFVCLAPILKTDVAMEESLRDVLAAVDYAKGLEFVDPNRIGIMGFSRGGLLTFMAATRRSDFKAVVMMAPAPGQGHLERVLPQARQVTAPVLLLVSENDRAPMDHVQVVRKFKQALESADKEVTLFLYPPYGNDGHRMFFELGAYWSDVVDFLKLHLF